MAIGIGSSFNEDNEYDGPLIGSSMREDTNYYASADSDRLYEAKKILKEVHDCMINPLKVGTRTTLRTRIKKFLNK